MKRNVSIEAKTGKGKDSRVLWSGKYDEAESLEDIATLIDETKVTEKKAVEYFNYGWKIQGHLNPQRTRALGAGIPPEIKAIKDKIMTLPAGPKRDRALAKIEQAMIDFMVDDTDE